MKIGPLIGAGDRILAATLPFAAIGIILNLVYPEFFIMKLGLVGTVLGCVFLVIGVPIWLASAIQVLVHVSRSELITTGPYRFVLHPLYTSVALLVLPGIGFVLDTWVGIGIGVVLYVCSRLLSVREERKLEHDFQEEYRMYRQKVFLPWL